MCQASRRIYPRATLGCIRQPRTVSFRLWLNIPVAVVDLPRKTSLLFIFALLGGDTLIYSARFADPNCRQAENTEMQTNQRRATYYWTMYDWANSAFATTVMAGFFPLFFKQYWSQGVEVTHSTYCLGVSSSVASLIIVILAPTKQQGQVLKLDIFNEYFNILTPNPYDLEFPPLSNFLLNRFLPSLPQEVT